MNIPDIPRQGGNKQCKGLKTNSENKAGRAGTRNTCSGSEKKKKKNVLPNFCTISAVVKNGVLVSERV